MFIASSIDDIIAELLEDQGTRELSHRLAVCAQPPARSTFPTNPRAAYAYVRPSAISNSAQSPTGRSTRTAVKIMKPVPEGQFTAFSRCSRRGQSSRPTCRRLSRGSELLARVNKTPISSSWVIPTIRPSATDLKDGRWAATPPSAAETTRVTCDGSPPVQPRSSHSGVSSRWSSQASNFWSARRPAHSSRSNRIQSLGHTTSNDWPDARWPKSSGS